MRSNGGNGDGPKSENPKNKSVHPLALNSALGNTGPVLLLLLSSLRGCAVIPSLPPDLLSFLLHQCAHHRRS